MDINVNVSSTPFVETMLEIIRTQNLIEALASEIVREERREMFFMEAELKRRKKVLEFIQSSSVIENCLDKDQMNTVIEKLKNDVKEYSDKIELKSSKTEGLVDENHSK